MTESSAICKRFFPLFAKTSVFLAVEPPKTRKRTLVGAGFDGRGEFNGEKNDAAGTAAVALDEKRKKSRSRRGATGKRGRLFIFFDFPI